MDFAKTVEDQNRLLATEDQQIDEGLNLTMMPA